MGQYFKVVNLTKKQVISPRSFGAGIKIMEHSWTENNMMAFVEKAMSYNGAVLNGENINWCNDKVVWVGDYSNGQFFFNLLQNECLFTNLYEFVSDTEMQSKTGIIFEELVNINDEDFTSQERYKYIMNTTKGEYVNLYKLPKPTPDAWIIHPLSLLTQDITGSGGGDYDGESGREYLGRWYGDNIMAVNSVGTLYSEIKPNFYE